jgi:3-methyladenine DNA glycosylase/8-oxoguanine DNA glycosylase
MPSRSVPIDRPLELRRVLAPLTGPWGRFGPDGWWRAMRTPAGPATLLVRRAGSSVEAEAWGAGAGWALERLPGLVGLLDPTEAFATDHPLIGEIARRHPGWRIGHTGLVYEALVAAVSGQKVTGREAGRGLRGLLRAFSDPAPGPPGLRLPPEPDRVAAAPYHAFHGLGIERRRADTLRRVAAEASRLDRLAGVSPLEAQARLRRIPGVGVWSAAETVAVSHGDPDAVSVGDFHLKHQVCWHLAGKARGSDELMLELLEPFRPHRGRVVRFLESLPPYPRYGPRSPVRSFERL